MLIDTTESLNALCERLKKHDFVTVDTEFIREKTYFPQLCLVQIASMDEAACIDPLAKDLDMSALFDLMSNPDVVKVFHAARQDIEIFFNMTGKIPTPVFDTQVAAMVCGFRESVSYQNLVAKLLKVSLDKSMRYTDWARRPLTDRQVEYALNDVTHLRHVYLKLKDKLAQNGREAWLSEEMDFLTDPHTYRQDPYEMWKRFKPTCSSAHYLTLLRELAAWREEEARRADRPRKHVMRDEMLLDIAASAPETAEELDKLRSATQGFAKSRYGKTVLEIVTRVKNEPVADISLRDEKREIPPSTQALIKMLRLLLSVKAAANGVAEKMIASSEDIDALGLGETAGNAVLQGWRYDVFGRDAQALMRGELAVRYNPDKKNAEVFKF